VSEGTDWQEWHRDYDDPESSVSHRLLVVRAHLARLLAEGTGPMRVLSMCAGDGRDVIPVVAAVDRDVELTLVELDPDLAEGARRAADVAGVRVDVRVADAGASRTYLGVAPVDLLVMVGVLGNVSDADARATVEAARWLVAPGRSVIWSRSNRFRSPATHDHDDPAEWVRDLFEAVGFETLDYVRPEVESEAWRLGVSRLQGRSGQEVPDRLFSFVR
jgi:hypothetical protein